MSSARLMLDSTSRGMPACLHTFSSVHPSRPAAQLTTFRAAWASKLNVSSTRPAPASGLESIATRRVLGRLVERVMAVEPCQSARRVFWITDNCSSRRGEKAAARLRAQWPTVTLVHTPNHASWLNQVEIYFSIVQRKVVIPNDFPSLSELEDLLAFQRRYEQMAKPFQRAF